MEFPRRDGQCILPNTVARARITQKNQLINILHYELEFIFNKNNIIKFFEFARPLRDKNSYLNCDTVVNLRPPDGSPNHFVKYIFCFHITFLLPHPSRIYLLRTKSYSKDMSVRPTSDKKFIHSLYRISNIPNRTVNIPNPIKFTTNVLSTNFGCSFTIMNVVSSSCLKFYKI